MLFVGVLFLVPAILLLSGRIIGVGGLAARNPGQFWLSLLACVLVALPIWACLDAISRDSSLWAMIGRNRTAWAGGIAIGAPFGVGFVLAVVYLIKVRPQLSMAELQSVVAVWGDEAELAAV